MEVLPEDCIAHILSCVTPQDVCRFTVVASAIRDAAESEVLWDKFLPPDYHQIISRSVCPLTFESKKELFFKLSAPILIDGGLKVITHLLYCIARAFFTSHILWTYAIF